MVALMFCSAIAVGCGDDDDSGNTSDAGDGGPVADAGNDAGGSKPGTGGMSGGTGGTTMTATGVKCGSTTCMPPGAGLIPGGIPGGLGGMACCVDDANGTCGTMMGSMCVPPPPVDPSCPTINFPILGAMGSCCADNGMCGADGSPLGMGCVDYEMVTKALGVLGGLLTLPDPQKCGDMDHDAGGTEVDGGH
jgi:hypothetical protein